MEQKWTQIETMEEHIRRADPLGSTVIQQGIETGAVNCDAISRAEPEVTAIQRVAQEVSPKERPPPPPETGSSGNAQGSSSRVNRAESPSGPEAGGAGASNENPKGGGGKESNQSVCQKNRRWSI